MQDGSLISNLSTLTLTSIQVYMQDGLGDKDGRWFQGVRGSKIIAYMLRLSRKVNHKP